MEDIKHLNTVVRTYLAPSKIHGVGVFALQDVKKGEPLFADMGPKFYKIPYEQFDKIRPEVAEQILGRWPQVVNGEGFAYPDTRVVAFMNHGKGEHANYDAYNDRALRDIKKNEEILEDYRKIPGHEKVFAFLTK